METIKKSTPKKIATAVIMWMKCSSSMASGVFPLPNPDARLAMRPITVLFPVLTTTPIPFPSTTLVEKKPRFFVSIGLSEVHSIERDCGSDSPVNEELSTYKHSIKV